MLVVYPVHRRLSWFSSQVLKKVDFIQRVVSELIPERRCTWLRCVKQVLIQNHHLKSSKIPSLSFSLSLSLFFLCLMLTLVVYIQPPPPPPLLAPPSLTTSFPPSPPHPFIPLSSFVSGLLSLSFSAGNFFFIHINVYKYRIFRQW